nr:probable aspartyl protease At4g16563 [Tanacetum cinerariifolium]
MAPPSPCSVFIYYPLIITCLTTTCFSKSLVFQLTHSLSNSPLLFFNSSHHLLKSTTTHSSHRFLHHHRQVSVALSPGSDYTMSFSLGSSQLPVTLYMDTGGDLVWVPWKPFTCIMCEGKSDPQKQRLYLTTSMLTLLLLHLSRACHVPVMCLSRACSSVHSKIPSSHLCAMSRCPLDSIEMSERQNYMCPSFYYAYGDDSFVGKLYYVAPKQERQRDTETLRERETAKIKNSRYGNGIDMAIKYKNILKKIQNRYILM